MDPAPGILPSFPHPRGENIATMWEAVFAEVDVSLIAILNSIRILRKEFE